MSHLRDLLAACATGLLCLSPLSPWAEAPPNITLIEAVKWHDTSEVERLIREGADVSGRGPEGYTPLIWASASGDVDLVRLLLFLGARLDATSALGQTPFMAAVIRAPYQMVELLVLEGASVNAATLSGHTALVFASLKGRVDVVRLLLEHGADVSAGTNEGAAPISIAANFGRNDVLRVLLEHEADVNAKGKAGVTPVMLAAYRGLTETVSLLVDSGADIDKTNDQGWTALMYAALAGYPDVVSFLLDKGADMHARNKDGKTAREIAAKHGRNGVVDVFLSAAGKAGRRQSSNPSRVDPQTGRCDVAVEASPRSPGSAGDRIVVEKPPTKVCQLVGEFDRQRRTLTLNRTLSRYGLLSTDLGVAFQHKGRNYLLFGDTAGIHGGDAIAWTRDINPVDGLDLDFVTGKDGAYKPISIPGVSQGGFEVPMEGVSVDGTMYIYHTTDHGRKAVMGRSILAVSHDDGLSFKYLYDLSIRSFINVSIVQTDAARLRNIPVACGRVLVMFGSGPYRKSAVHLAIQPSERVESRQSIRYFAGFRAPGIPSWSEHEADAQPIVDSNCVGELSVTYNEHINRWIMLYNCARRGKLILMRTAKHPWGPWSPETILLDPVRDDLFCEYVHRDWRKKRCDILHDPGRENDSGGCYGPYQIESLASGDGRSTTIYFTLSTWNPYTVILMKTTLRKTEPEPSSPLASENRRAPL